jgi:hypothetical protein
LAYNTKTTQLQGQEGINMAHDTQHPRAGQTVLTQKKSRAGYPELPAREAVLEDWWDRVSGKSWMYSEGNPAAMDYAARSGLSGLPIDNEVVYAKINGFGYLFHESELTRPSAYYAIGLKLEDGLQLGRVANDHETLVGPLAESKEVHPDLAEKMAIYKITEAVA